MLVSLDVDVSGVNDSGQTPLHLAAAIGNTQACRLLLSAGAFPDIADELSNTPLHLAVAIGNYDTAVVLIREGLCDLDPVGQFNKTPLQLALSSKQYKLAQLLYDSGASVTRNELDILRVAAGIEAGANAPAVYWICHSEEDYPSAVRLRKELARSGIKSSVELCFFFAFCALVTWVSLQRLREVEVRPSSSQLEYLRWNNLCFESLLNNRPAMRGGGLQRLLPKQDGHWCSH
jgi:hypothetical protein